MKKLNNKTFEKNPSALFSVTAISLVIFAFAFGQRMYSATNLVSLAFQIPEFGFVAIAMMLSFLLGGIDLSIIAIANLSGIIAAQILTGNWLSFIPSSLTIIVAVICSLITSIILGSFNGFLVTYFGVPSLIATLGTMTFYTGIAKAITNGKSIVGFPESFTRVGITRFIYIPLIFILFLFVALIVAIVLERTSLGRKIMLSGESPVVALFSAINNKKIMFIVFIIIGFLGGMSGLTIISRVNSAKVGYGEAYLLQAMIVCVIGGIHPSGGKGRILGVIIAIILMQMLSSAFTIMMLSPYTTKMIWGLMLILVMGLTRESNKIHLLYNYILKRINR